MGRLAIVLAGALLLRPAGAFDDEARDRLRREPGLAAPTSLQRQGQPVGELLRELTTAQGPELACAPPTAWMRVSVFATNRPRQALLDDLAQLLNGDWQGEPPARYRFVLPAHARRYEENLRHASRDRAWQPVAALGKAAWQPVDVWAQQRQEAEARWQVVATRTDPPALPSGEAWETLQRLQLLSSPVTNTTLRLLTTLTEAQRRELLDAEELTLPAHALTPSQTELVRRLLADHPRIYDQQERPLSKEQIAAQVAGAFRQVERSGLTLRVHTSPVTGDIGSVEIRPGSGGVYVPDRAAPALSLPVRGFPYPERDRQRFEVDAIVGELEASPCPRALISLGTDRRPWPELVAEIARALPPGFTVLSDEFVASLAEIPTQTPAPFPTPTNLAEGLDALCTRRGKLWWRRGNTLFFRSRTWFFDGRYETPPPIQTALEAALRKKAPDRAQVLEALSRMDRWQIEGLAGQSDLALWRATGNHRIRSGRHHAREVVALLQRYRRLPPPLRRQTLRLQCHLDRSFLRFSFGENQGVVLLPLAGLTVGAGPGMLGRP